MVFGNADIREKYGFSAFVSSENKEDNGQYLADLFRLVQPKDEIAEYEFEVFASKEEAEKKYKFMKVE